MKTRVGIIFGGRSGEHEISVRSARTVLEQIDKEKYEVVPIAIDKSGHWLSPSQSLQMLPPATAGMIRNGIGQFSLESIALIGDTRYKGLTVIGERNGADAVTRLDVVFPVLHGTYGEDGTVQGLLEMADLPYVGCGVLGSACGMDKTVMKALFLEAGLPICKYVWFLRSEWEQNPQVVIRRLEQAIGYPAFVKPANLGSSLGISRAEDAESLRRAVSLAAEYDRKIIVEESLEMREIECAVIGNDNPEASLPGEYIIRDQSRAFLDYDEKYAGTGNNEFVVPAPVSDELSTKIRELAIRAFKAVDGSGLARVDFFLRKDVGTLLVNEINTMPGLTDASGFPKMWAGTGMDFPAVIETLINLAIERHQDRSRNKTSFDG